MSLVLLDTTFSHLCYPYDFTVSLLHKKNKQKPTTRDWEESLERITYKVSHKVVYMTLSSVILQLFWDICFNHEMQYYNSAYWEKKYTDKTKWKDLNFLFQI